MSLKRNRAAPWTAEEDKKLEVAVGQNDHTDWNLIAGTLPGRTSKQCWSRYKYHIHNLFQTGGWTPEEDEIIIQQQGKRGNRWSEIAQQLPGRSDNAVKNRWHSSLKRRKREDAPSAHDIVVDQIAVTQLEGQLPERFVSRHSILLGGNRRDTGQAEQPGNFMSRRSRLRIPPSRAMRSEPPPARSRPATNCTAGSGDAAARVSPAAAAAAAAACGRRPARRVCQLPV